MFGYDVKYRDDLRYDGMAVRRVWPENDEVFPDWFLDKIKSKGWPYEVMLKSRNGIHCIDLV